MLDKIEQFYRQGNLREIDYFLTEALSRQFNEQDEDVLIATALTSKAIADNHVCINLAELANRVWPDSPAPDTQPDSATTDKLCQITLPPLTAWQNKLQQSELCSGDNSPLILDGHRLYLRRYFKYEDLIAEKMLHLASQPDSANIHTHQQLRPLIEAVFPDAEPDNQAKQASVEVQREAARQILQRRLLIISGGPGTGKTYTLARLLAILLAGSNAATPPTVKMAAPTGKAAMRMRESIKKAKNDIKHLLNNSTDSRLNPLLDIIDHLPEECGTLHRLLGYQNGSPYFRHNAENPLSTDILIIDEASMIDLPMMAKILDAMPCNTKLILLGDMHQLASVDPGAVLGDICSAGEAASTTPLATAIKKLTYSHRFNINAPVGQLSMALHQAGGADDPSGDIALNILQKLSQASGSGEGVYQHAVPLSLRDSASHPIRDLRQLILENYKKFLQAVSPQQAFKALENFRVLSPLRQGPHGISTLNRLIEDILSLQNIKIAKPDFAALIPSVEFYNHRVIMITSNNYGLQLFNGDIGIVLPENADTPPLDNSTSNRNVVWFERPAATPEEASFRPVPCNMLPPHETAFAMSIHKSQGSQYKNVMVIVPAHDNKNLFTKELLYTAITRAEEKVFLWCNDDTFKAAAIRKARRTSGLVERINLKTAAQSNDICLPSAQIDLE